MNGQSYKVSRSSYDAGLDKKSLTVSTSSDRSTPINGSTNIIPTEDANSPTILAFKGALNNAESVMSKQADDIKRQSEDIRKQSSRIELLEKFISANLEKLGGNEELLHKLGIAGGDINGEGGSLTLEEKQRSYSPISSAALGHMNSSIDSGSTNSNKPRIGLAARRRAESATLSRSMQMAEDREGELMKVSTAANAVGDASEDISPLSVVSAPVNMENTNIETLKTPAATATSSSVEIGTPLSELKLGGSEAMLEECKSTSKHNKDTPTQMRRSLSDGGATMGDNALLLAAESQGTPKSTETQLLIDSRDPSPMRQPPKGLAARLSMGSRERRKLSLSRKNSSNKLVEGAHVGTSNASTPLSSTKKHNRGKLTRADSEASIVSDISASENGAPALASRGRARTDSVTPSPVETPTGLSRKSLEQFKWNQKQSYLFIAHDNPQLGSTVSTHLRTDPNRTMECVFESKEESGTTCFITGQIIYSGPFEGIEGAVVDTDSSKTQRGSQCLVAVNMKGYKCDLKALPHRNQQKGEIIELDIGGTDSKQQYTLATDAQLKDFLKTCMSRVDVILDPYHDRSWYPYWEGRRKMAPQFRSKGIGYLRLGDDMSNYGSAFLSLDAGATFLDDGATSIVESPAGLGSVGFSTYPPSGSSRGYDTPGFSSSMRSGFIGSGRRGESAPYSANSTGSRPKSKDSVYSDISLPYGNVEEKHGNVSCTANSNTEEAGGGANEVGQPSFPGLFHPDSTHLESDEREGEEDKSQDASPRELEMKHDEIRELVTILKDDDLKWAQRTQHLQRLKELTEYLGQGDGVMVEKNTTAVIGVLTNTLTKNNNPHVLRSAVSCLPDICDVASKCTGAGVAWKVIILESFHLLRTTSRSVYEEAKFVLDALHRGEGPPSIGITYLTGMLNEVVAGPRGKGSNGASNTARTLQWLTEAASHELDFSLKAFASWNTSAFCPSIYERIDASTLLSRCQSLLTHREEATREGMVQFASHIIVLDIVQNSDNIDKFLSRAEESQTAAGSNIKLKGMSNSCINILGVFQRLSTRMHERIITAMCKLYNAKGKSLRVYKSDLPLSSSTNSGVTTHSSSTKDRYSPSLLSERMVGSRLNSANRSRNSSAHSQRSNNTPPDPSKQVGPNSPRQKVVGSAKSSPTNAAPSTRKSPQDKPLTAPVEVSKDDAVPTRNNDTRERDGDMRSPRNRPKTEPVRSPGSTGSPGEGGNKSLSSLQESVSNRWFETRMMLKVVPSTESGWNQLVKTSGGCDDFVKGLSLQAQSLEVSRGLLLRAVLPFNEETSSNDQSKITSPIKQNGSSPASNKLQSLINQMDSSVVEQLRTSAVALRKLIRVKMSDEADLQQARTAAHMLSSFCKDVEKVSQLSGQTPIQVICSLEQ
jgi:hypothetical protein